MSDDVFDLGYGFSAQYTSVAKFGACPGYERAGLIVYAPDPCDACRLGVSLLFDLPGLRKTFPNRSLWSASGAPGLLTLTPSVLFTCCHKHGFITLGRWVPC